MESTKQPEGEITRNQIWLGIFFIFLFVGAMFSAEKVSKWLSVKDTKHEEEPIVIAQPPEDEVPAIGGPEIQIVDITTSTYAPPANVFSKGVYEKQIKRLGLWGNFQDAVLLIRAETTNEKNNFITVNLGAISGTYKAERLKTGGISVKPDGLLTNKQSSTTFWIDLKNPVELSRNMAEVQKGLPGARLITLWDTIAPPPEFGTVVNVLVAPYSEDGIYGDGSSISQIQLNYICEGEEESCKAFLCDPGMLGTACIEKYISKEASRSYQKGLKAIE